MDADLRDFLEDHAISDEVGQARPYIRWIKSDREPIRVAYDGIWPGALRYMVTLAGKEDGWIITRHAPPELDGLAHIWPEIRPDRKVRTGPPALHYHGDPAKADAAIARFQAWKVKEALVRHPGRKPKPPKVEDRSRKPRTVKRHINRGRDPKRCEPDDHRGHNTSRWQPWHATKRPMSADEVHYHEDLGKYLFAPAPKVPWNGTHEHADFERAWERARHVKRWHDGHDVDGCHRHVDQKLLVKDRDSNFAKRIDLHPLAVAKLRAAQRIFFVIEGCLKSDSILSTGAAVFSVPSVTLWNAPELDQFVRRYLLGKEIVIIPDADWFKNSLVLTQALLCRSWFRKRGFHAVVAAPPIAGLEVEPEIKGVDDFLAVPGNTLADLDVIDREPAEGIRGFVEAHARRCDGADRDKKVLRALSLHAGRDGTYRASLRSMAQVMDIPHQQVSRALKDLIEWGAVTKEGDLSTRFPSTYSHTPDWSHDDPRITLAPELRARRKRTRKLGVERSVPMEERAFDGTRKARQRGDQMRAKNMGTLTTRDLVKAGEARQALEFGILRDLRDRADIGLSEAARTLGMSKSALSLYERGLARPSARRALVLREFMRTLLAAVPREAA